MEKLTLSTAQIIPLAIFCLLVSIMGLFGNGLVVYSSVRYNTIKLDRISILFVRNLAVADILYSLITVVPLTITYFAGGYVLGDVYCFISAHLAFTPGSVNSLTVLTITAYRLRVILLPLYSVSKRFAHISLSLVWLFSLAGPAISLGYKSQFMFVPGSARCLSTIYVNKAAAPVFGIVFILQTVVPIVLITLCNIVLLLVAHRQRRKHGRNTSSNIKGYVTVLFLSGLFICSLTPFVVFAYLKTKGIKVPPALDLMAFHFIFLNVGGNPVLYTMTNRRFGNYVKGLAIKVMSCGRLGEHLPGGSTSNSNSRGAVLPARAISVTVTSTNIGTESITFRNPTVQKTEL